jgi:hypothetical protein
MFSTNLKRPALALAVTAGLLAVAGPASARGGDRVGATSLKVDTEITDYVRLSTASDGHQGSPVFLVDKDLIQPDMGIREHPTLVNAPHSLSIGSAEVFELNTMDGEDALTWTNGDRRGPSEAGPIGFTAPSEMDANAKAFLPEVNDEVLAGVNYEPDYIEGTQFVELNRSQLPPSDPGAPAPDGPG